MTARLLAEMLGTALLIVGVVGSGIMGESLADGNTAVALLANSIATGCVLYVLITILGPVSGAHFNPAVTFALALRREITPGAALAYAKIQIAGGVLGVWITHLMFGLPVLQLSDTARSGAGQWTAEIVAAFGLVLAILGGLRYRAEAVPALVALYVTGAYWFTASTSLANPAVTIARTMTDTFAGILPWNAPAFILMQLIGAALAVGFGARLFRGAPG